MTEQDALADIEVAIVRESLRWGIHAEDFAQELRTKAIEVFRNNFDPSKGKWGPYAAGRLRHMAIDIARTQKLVARGKRQVMHFTSLDTTVFDDEGNQQRIDPEDSRRDFEYSDWTDVEMKMLADPEMEILLAYLQLGTMAEVAEVYGCSESRVSKLLSAYRDNESVKCRLANLLGIEP